MPAHVKPENPRFEPQCKMCIYSRKTVDEIEHQVFDYIADQVRGGMSYTKAHGNAGKLCAEKEWSFKPPNLRAVINHFQKHLSALDKIKIDVAQEMVTAAPVTAVPIDQQMYDPSKVDAVNKDNFDEYDELTKLYTKFRETTGKIYEFEHALRVPGTHGEAQWSQTKIQTYNAMVNTQKSILAEIAKMRQGDKMIAISAKFILEEFTRGVVHKLKSELDSFVAILRRQSVPNHVIEAFEELTGPRIVQLFSEEAGNAMDVTKREFKLPN